jgi:hypothetical protein
MSEQHPISAKISKSLGTWVVAAGVDVGRVTRGRGVTAHISACSLTTEDRMNQAPRGQI